MCNQNKPTMEGSFVFSRSPPQTFACLTDFYACYCTSHSSNIVNQCEKQVYLPDKVFFYFSHVYCQYCKDAYKLYLNPLSYFIRHFLEVFWKELRNLVLKIGKILY